MTGSREADTDTGPGASGERPTEDRASPWKSLLQVIGVVAIALVGLLATEFGLRLAFPDRVVVVEKSAAPVFEFHPEYSVALRANLTREFHHFPDNGGDTIVWRTNADGFRGPPLRPDAEFRVFVYGDSNIQGRFSSFESSYVGRLQEHLRPALGRDVQVVNAGVDGSGPDQLLLRFAEQSREYSADLVVFNIFADNDLGDLVRNRLFEIGPDGALRKTEHERVPDEQLTAGRRSYYRELAASLLVVRAAQRLLPGGAEEGDGAGGTGGDGIAARVVGWVAEEYAVYAAGAAREYSHFFDHYDSDVATEPDSESATVKRTLLAGVLSAADSVARLRGVPLVVQIQPSVMDLAPENVAWDTEPIRSAPGYSASNLTDAAEWACAESGAHCLNLFDLFESNTPSDLFLLRDDHWSDTGQDLAARAAAAFIVETLFADEATVGGAAAGVR